MNSVKDFVLYDNDGEQEVELSETEKRTAKRVVKYGELNTHDNRKIELYEVTVEDYSKVKIARVGLGALVKRLIIGNNAVFATFKYEDVTDKHWRFSFIAYDSFFEDGKVQTKETNPKRYTYVFGDKDETYRTAIDRFKELDSKFEIKVKDIQDAFAVEAMSKEFFDEYKTHYAKFVKFLTGDEFQNNKGKIELVEVQNPSLFLSTVFTGNKKLARDFCKKLLGQTVFIYFLQKKGWMGSPTGEYRKADGNKSFLEFLFIESGSNNDFYKHWMSKLFYDTLNMSRKNDDFKMPNGEIVKIPYLNGGLFEKDYENLNELQFPSDYFSKLFEFFNRFNFTIYENSPEEHTVAVDPEMLGHIFENLLEDNKDKGAFYTPKEIVQYMSQESLIEYLATHLGEESKYGITKFVKQKNKESLPDSKLSEINNLLDKVKICDPAIGSGAFPMGMLHEIFSLKERIAFETNNKDWNPATVKENIIQNSIYGVDLEKGAVDIAQLRFWLSLVVDEDEPKPLPNLAYKILVGDSLVSKFEGKTLEIDWDRKGSVGDADNIVQEIRKSLKLISSKQKEFFTNNVNSKKTELKSEIRQLKLDVLTNQLSFNKALYINKNQKVIDMGFGLKATEIKKNKEIDKNIDEFDEVIEHLNELKKTPEKPFNHFDWRLDFPEILNPIVAESIGFDIVIGNPPYGVSINGSYRDTILKSLGKVPDFEIYYYFTEKAYDLVKEKGVLSYIIPNTYLFNTFASSYRIDLFNKWELTEILDCTKFNIFQTATVRNTINTWKKGKSENVGYRKTKNQENFKDLISKERLLLPSKDLLEMNQNWGLAFMLDANIIEIISDIKKNKTPLSELFPDISQGLIAYDKYQGQSQETIKNRIYHYKSFDKPDLKKWLWGADITKFKVEWNGEEYIDYCDGIANPRDSKFFIGERLLVREITNPSIFAGITDEELYNDPALIIVKSSYQYSVKWLAAILNSKLGSFFHFNYSPKATKGAFPKILVKDIKDFPIRIPDNIQLFSIITDYLIFLYNTKSKNIITHTENKRIGSHIQDVLDMMVYELYFETHMKENGLDVLQFIKPEPIDDIIDDDKKGEIIEEFYLWYQKPENEVRQRILLIETRSKDILSVIRKSIN